MMALMPLKKDGGCVSADRSGSRGTIVGRRCCALRLLDQLTIVPIRQRLEIHTIRSVIRQRQVQGIRFPTIPPAIPQMHGIPSVEAVYWGGPLNPHEAFNRFASRGAPVS
jgi:hypothetical protein